MKQLDQKYTTLAAYVDSLQANSRYTFTRADALAALPITENAFKQALNRLIRKRRVIKPRKEFYVIVPLEYQNTGGQPPSWYIDDLMKFQKQPYYVGLLSAAALHGAAHQQPQQFQIVTNKSLRPIIISRYSIRFFTKQSLEKVSTLSIKTTTGYMQVSTPETTAFDLLRYVDGAGGLNHVATVLTELQEKINAEALLKTAQAEPELAHVQRVGYLLDLLGAEEQAKLLGDWIGQQKTRIVPLDPTKPFVGVRKNSKWRVYINEQVEAD